MSTILNKTGVEVQRDLNEGLDNQPKDNFVYDDFSFPVINLAVNPATSKPDFDQNEVEFLFSPSTVESVTGSQITRHGFKIGDGVEWIPHIHWFQSQTGTVKWELQYKIWCANELEPSFTTVTSTNQVFTYTSGVLHQITAFNPIPAPTNSTACVVKVRVSRLADDAEDTYAVDARFSAFDFHVPIDQAGSRQEFTK